MSPKRFRRSSEREQFSRKDLAVLGSPKFNTNRNIQSAFPSSFSFLNASGGRIERRFSTAQDRLVKQLRLAHISTLERADEFLEKDYWPEWNADQRFARHLEYIYSDAVDPCHAMCSATKFHTFGLESVRS